MATILKTVLAQALARIKPAQASVPREVRATLKDINAGLARARLKAKAVLGGSFAKGTYLKDDFDVDIFVLFDAKKYGDADLSGLLANALKPFKPTRLHGSRDYFQFCKGKIQYEVVPVLAVKKPAQAKNVTDCSPLHVAWVSRHVKKLHDDIRLAKQFFKAAGVYGAESYIRGFSGHVIDLLVITHKGFLPLLHAITKWRAPVVIDYLNAHKGRALQRLNPAKTQSPLIVVDPVQPDRNASASLSHEKYDVIIQAARAFLAKPSLEAFEIREPDLDAISKKGPTIILTATSTTGKHDVVGSRLLQAHELIKKELVPFVLTDSGWWWQPAKPALFYYVLGSTQLPETVTITGPPLHLTRHAEAFKKKHPTAAIVKKRLVAREPRLERTPQAVLKRVLVSPYIKERVKTISIRKQP